MLSNAAYSVHLQNQLPQRPPLPLDLILELIIGSSLLIISTLLAVFNDPQCCNDSRRLGIKDQTWIVKLYSPSLSHPLRPISISAANEYAEKLGKNPYRILDFRPSFADLTRRALLFNEICKDKDKDKDNLN